MDIWEGDGGGDCGLWLMVFGYVVWPDGFSVNGLRRLLAGCHCIIGLGSGFCPYIGSWKRDMRGWIGETVVMYTEAGSQVLDRYRRIATFSFEKLVSPGKKSLFHRDFWLRRNEAANEE
jgi:hypothetical protein